MKPNGSFQGVSPVLLASSCDVLSGNSAVPDSGQLSYPFRKAVYIEEVRWTLRVALGNLFQLGQFVYVKMMLGQHYLMRDPVPLWVAGTSMSSAAEQAFDAASNGVAADTAYSSYRWRFPEPLYVEAGQVLRSVFSRNIDIYGSVHVQVAYAGRTVPPNQPLPGVIAVPYVAPFVTTVGNTYQESNEFNLLNPFNTPLRVQRLTGRVSIADGNTAGVRPYLTPSANAGNITLLVDDSWGGKMVGTNTGPSDVFDFSRAAWTVDTVMPPKGVYKVRAWNIPSNVALHVGMVGVREEPL